MLFKTDKYHPSQDGINHINIYSKGKTELGRFLSNFTQSEINTPEGKFASIEGYWGYLGVKDVPQREQLRSLYGFKAKYTKKCLMELYGGNFDENFEEKIKNAILDKLEKNKAFLISQKHLFKLPFVHYYCFPDKVSGVQVVVDATNDNKWWIDTMTEYISKL